MEVEDIKVKAKRWNWGEGCCDTNVESALRLQKEGEIKFLEEWLVMYSEGEYRMLVCERDVFERIKELKTELGEVSQNGN